MPVQMTGDLMQSDTDDGDVPTVAQPQGYIGDQSAMVAALTAELTSKGVLIEAINQNLPIVESVAQTLIATFAPAVAPIAAGVIAALPKQIPT